MNRLFLHLGSNEGDRYVMIQNALQFIQKEIGKIVSQSTIYETEAWGKKDQKDFLNLAIQVETEEGVEEVLKRCKQIEVDLGGVKLEQWGPRKIDIDILFYNNAIIKEGDLKIPHPMIEKRNFVLIPLMEIAGQYIHPILEKSIEELYEESEDNCEVWEYEDSHN